MKKVLVIILFCILMLSLISCQSKIAVIESKETQSASSSISIEENKGTLTVKIIANYDADARDGLPIILTYKIEGKYDKPLQYHWILETKYGFEGFVIPEMGPQNEIINAGEPVKLGLFALVDYISTAYDEIKVKMQIEDKGTQAIIAADEIIIENRAGSYSIRQ